MTGDKKTVVALLYLSWDLNGPATLSESTNGREASVGFEGTDTF